MPLPSKKYVRLRGMESYCDECHPYDCYPAYEVGESPEVEGPFSERALAKGEPAENRNSITVGQHVSSSSILNGATVIVEIWTGFEEALICMRVQKLPGQDSTRTAKQLTGVALHERIKSHLMYNPIVEMETCIAKNVLGNLHVLFAYFHDSSQYRILCSLLMLSCTQSCICLSSTFLPALDR